jgi:erythromycin esterase-like protein
VTTLVIILVLVAVAVLAVATIPLMIRSTRRQAGGPRQPALGSPAQVWVSRAERVLRELVAALTDHEAWRGVIDDAEQVAAELKLTASRVADLDQALAQVDPSLAATERMRTERETLLTRMESAVAGLERARAEVLELLVTPSSVISDPDPVRELNSRLAGLRAGLVEVRGLTDPEIGSGTERDGQGHP